MNIERLRQLLDYNPETGVLMWRARPEYTGKRAAWNVKYAGQVAGSSRADGYVCIRIEKKSFLAHRIAWALSHNCWPEQDIDHRDGNPANNRLCNLRAATHAQNLCNARRPSRNASGFKGVSFFTRRGRYRAYISVEGKPRHLGYFDTAEAAHAAYTAAAHQFHGEFARVA